MNYVVHFCKNPDCNNCWIDKDKTHVKTVPPKWKYCKECCKNLVLILTNKNLREKLMKIFNQRYQTRGKIESLYKVIGKHKGD